MTALEQAAKDFQEATDLRHEAIDRVNRAELELDAARRELDRVDTSWSSAKVRLMAAAAPNSAAAKALASLEKKEGSAPGAPSICYPCGKPYSPAEGKKCGCP